MIALSGLADIAALAQNSDFQARENLKASSPNDASIIGGTP
jgi:hypothetical protein